MNPGSLLIVFTIVVLYDCGSASTCTKNKYADTLCVKLKSYCTSKKKFAKIIKRDCCKTCQGIGTEQQATCEDKSKYCSRLSTSCNNKYFKRRCCKFCSVSDHPCDKPSNGGCSQTCKKDGAGLVCKCRRGYQLNVNGKTCDFKCEDRGVKCEEGKELGRCKYKWFKNSCCKTCKSVHVCETASKGGCSQICEKNGAGVVCKCRDGYELNGDKKTCDLVDTDNGGGTDGGKEEADDRACVINANKFRQLHQDTSDLVYDKTLTDAAQKWADSLNTPGLTHATGTGQGENLYSSSFWPSRDVTKAEFCQKANEAWYSEIQYWDEQNSDWKAEIKEKIEKAGNETYRNKLKRQYAVGHFTQMVWKGTTNVGFGFAAFDLPNNGVKTVVVARYLPQGNIGPMGPSGRYSENVGVLKSTRKNDEDLKSVIDVVTKKDENIIKKERTKDQIIEKFFDIDSKDDKEELNSKEKKKDVTQSLVDINSEMYEEEIKHEEKKDESTNNLINGDSEMDKEEMHEEKKDEILNNLSNVNSEMDEEEIEHEEMKDTINIDSEMDEEAIEHKEKEDESVENLIVVDNEKNEEIIPIENKDESMENLMNVDSEYVDWDENDEELEREGKKDEKTEKLLYTDSEEDEEEFMNEREEDEFTGKLIDIVSDEDEEEHWDSDRKKKNFKQDEITGEFIDSQDDKEVLKSDKKKDAEKIIDFDKENEELLMKNSRKKDRTKKKIIDFIGKIANLFT